MLSLVLSDCHAFTRDRSIWKRGMHLLCTTYTLFNPWPNTLVVGLVQPSITQY